MTTFTPTYSGPMRVEQRPDGSFAILDHNDNLFAVAWSSVDARLIAAAPDLLAMCQNAVEALEGLSASNACMSDFERACIPALKAAINKAQSL